MYEGRGVPRCHAEHQATSEGISVALSTGGHAVSCGYGAGAPGVDRSLSIEADAAHLVEYKVTTASGAAYPTLYLDVAGFSE
jgi:hypothetical protein